MAASKQKGSRRSREAFSTWMMGELFLKLVLFVCVDFLVTNCLTQEMSSSASVMENVLKCLGNLFSTLTVLIVIQALVKNFFFILVLVFTGIHHKSYCIIVLACICLAVLPATMTDASLIIHDAALKTPDSALIIEFILLSIKTCMHKNINL